MSSTDSAAMSQTAKILKIIFFFPKRKPLFFSRFINWTEWRVKTEWIFFHLYMQPWAFLLLFHALYLNLFVVCLMWSTLTVVFWPIYNELSFVKCCTHVHCLLQYNAIFKNFQRRASLAAGSKDKKWIFAQVENFNRSK